MTEYEKDLVDKMIKILEWDDGEQMEFYEKEALSGLLNLIKSEIKQAVNEVETEIWNNYDYFEIHILEGVLKKRGVE